MNRKYFVVMFSLLLFLLAAPANAQKEPIDETAGVLDKEEVVAAAQVCCFDTIAFECVPNCDFTFNCYCGPQFCGRCAPGTEPEDPDKLSPQ